MGIRAKILLGITVALLPAYWFMLDWLIEELTPQYRQSTEEPLVDASQVLAAVAAQSIENDSINVRLFRRAFAEIYQRPLAATIYGFTKKEVDFRVYITDRAGIVLFDSFNAAAEGEDYSQWRDVRLTLAGEYGARTSRDIPLNPPSSIMYVAAPIIHQGEIIGVLSVGKPTRNANQFVEETKQKILFMGILCGIAALGTGVLVASGITRPVQRLTSYAAAIRDGKRALLPKLPKGELREMGEAFEAMRETLEGKKYVEHYVQTLTHEIKSPLAAIQGACELLQEKPPAEQQQRFLSNIATESQRIADLVEKLLLLSRLEAKTTLEDTKRLDLSAVLEEITTSFLPHMERKQVRLERSIASQLFVNGEQFLLRQALANVLQNAIEFSPSGGTIDCSLQLENECVLLRIVDDGPGLPAYAADRVFERFYSLPRPDTGRKSSGLGLSLVKEVVEIHGGKVSLQNIPQRGCEVRISLPQAA